MNEGQHTYKEQGCDDEPASEQIVEESGRERDRHHHEQPAKSLFEQWRDLDIAKRIESSVAVIGLIIGAFVAYVALNQLSAMRQQTESMQGQLVEMQKQSASSLQTFKQQQRAYLAIGDDALVFVDGPLKPNRPIQVNIRYRNFGVSPATNIRVHKGILIANDGIKKVKKLEVPRDSPTSVLPPGAHGILTTPEFRGFTVEQWVMFMQGDTVPNNIHIIAHGTITYDDAFSDGHETEFCFQYVTGGLWRYCPDHNHIN